MSPRTYRKVTIRNINDYHDDKIIKDIKNSKDEITIKKHIAVLDKFPYAEALEEAERSK